MSLLLIVELLVSGLVGFAIAFAFFRQKISALQTMTDIAVSDALLQVEREFNGKQSALQGELHVTATRLEEREKNLKTLQETLSETQNLFDRLKFNSQDLELRERTLTARLDDFKLASDKRANDEDALKDAFRLLSLDALSKSNEAFLPLAKQVLADQQKEAKEHLERKHDEVGGLLQPMKDLLTQLKDETHALEVKREGAYAGLLTEVKNIQETHESLRAQTHQLVAALRDSGTRGNWGAVQLKRCLEFAGMLEHCCFELEKSVRTDTDETQRPDCVVTLPGKRTIVIDAKTPMKAFLDALAATDDAARQSHLAQHAKQLKTHLTALQGKAYWKQFKDSPDFVICFLPVEALLSAALSQDPDLITFEDGKVLLATPTTLIALMRVIAFGWKQISLARDAQKIHDLAVSVYDKLTSVHDSFKSIGKNIQNTASSWEKMRTQIEGKGGVFSLGRKLQKYEISKDELANITELHLGMHDLQADDWKIGVPMLLPALAADAEISIENGDSVTHE